MFPICSRMTIETLGEAWSQGWRVRVKCASGKGDGMKRHRECLYTADLDMNTLLMAKGVARIITAHHVRFLSLAPFAARAASREGSTSPYL